MFLSAGFHRHIVSLVVTFNRKAFPPSSDPYSPIFDAAQGKSREALSLINKRFEISRYRRLAATCPINMPVWGALKKDPSKKPPRIVKRLDGKTPSTKRTKRIRSSGEGPSPKKRKTRTKA